MLGFFRKAGNSMKRMLLSTDEDVYNDEYYGNEDQYYEEQQYEDDPMEDHYSSVRQAPERVERQPAKSRSTYADKVIELGYSGAGSAYHSAPAVNTTPSVQASAIIAHPKEIKDACKICDDICSGKMVIVDLTSLDSANAQRIADYLGGVVHTLQGKTRRVNKGIFVIAPREFDVNELNLEENSRDYRPLRAASSDRY